MFLSAVAGPSRIPIAPCAVPLARVVVRSYATDSDVVKHTPTLTPTVDRPGARPRVRYPAWRKSIGKEYKYVVPGAKAKWLGGAVPYPMNPSFRPPAPLGDEAQDVLYAQMKAGQKTLGEISAEYNVSIARLEAIRKLKQVEESFKKFNVPLQTAFRDGMEPLLGCKDLVKLRWARGTGPDEGSVAELEEEKRWNAGVGSGGAFGNRNKPLQGWEKTVFEWRGEDESFDAKAAGVSADLFPTPQSERTALAKARPGTKSERPAKIVEKNASTSWRFNDFTSAGVPQDMNVIRQMEKRERKREKRNLYKNKKRGIFE